MNFQRVAANNGNLVAMFATVVELGSQKFNVNQKPIQTVKLKDDNGEQHNVTINKGKGELLSSPTLGQRLAFNLSTYQGTSSQGSYTGYSGFWNSQAQVNQPAPQQTQQAPSQAPQQDNSQKEMRTIRKDCLSAVMSVTDVPLDMVKNYLIASVQWILTGVWEVSLLNKPKPTKELPPQDDDIPWEQG